MELDRRTLVKGGILAAGMAATGTQAQPGRSRAKFRRIAVEEAWSIPEHMDRIGQIAGSTWDNLDLRSLRGTSAKSPLGVRLIDMDERLRQMDADAVDMHVLSLTSPGVQMFDPDTAVAMAELANDRMAEQIRSRPNRFAGLASFAPQDPARAAKEMERAINSLKLNGFVVNSHTNNEYLDLEKYWPILEAAEALDAPIYIHPRAPADTMAGPFSDYNMHQAIWGYQAETGTHAMRLILSGVFDRFPKLQIVLGHMGENIPFHLWRTDHFFEFRRKTQRSSLLPSEVLKRNFMITNSGVQHLPALEYCLKVLGADRIMWAIDYPYEASSPAVEFMNNAAISDEDKRKIFHLNAERVFKIAPQV